jgi:serine/threonine-protein kinase HipA
VHCLLERAHGQGLSEFEYLTLSYDMFRWGTVTFIDADPAIIRRNIVQAVPRLVGLEKITVIARASEWGKGIFTQEMQFHASYLGDPLPKLVITG